METIAKLFVRVREWQRRVSKGQTMAEYSLIVAAVAVVVVVSYQAMGQDIGSLVNSVNTDLTSAS